ncbi:DUF2572 family protein [Avibacterium paragallinarum]|uniref:DUF2572 family protein n=1 Tax=Avibacterium paragallinarum TaxID=728 RepID=UPI00021ACD1F|nr:DUF2572 family protein [Avibacterium paragallinarum]AZI14912.1 DUF2572 family protein [Avibacterium paragallinarum]QIR12346.1 DUF2572 family protein [Avibacterium paragallinarum]QJE10369.1 DUF2572 family protein [Avibacterium paragallinarum]QJE12562.1 DUF2572 family protein [Avibacterium paragallinarum]QJE14766.1 DUF2572 family protein [Avibacterium paragallinarum]
MIVQKGIATLSLLILISSLLMITMFFNQEILHLYLAMNVQKQHYFKNDLTLIEMSRTQASQTCEQLPIDYPSSIYHLVFKNTEKNDRTSHFSWCERISLFRNIPNKSMNEGDFNVYFSPSSLSLFADKLKQFDKNHHSLYWFSTPMKEWDIAGNIKAVIMSEGDLIIRGQGEIRGAVITKGKLIISDEIKLIYNKNVINEVVEHYRFWRLAKRSWNDFETL